MAQNLSDEARRAYWTETMDAAADFMKAIEDYPVAECGEPLVALRPALERAGVDAAFSDRKVAETFDRIFWLREGLIDDVAAIAQDMNRRGWVLKIEDGYRTRAIQTGLGRQPSIFDLILKKVIWERRGTPPTPEDMFHRLTALVATCPKIGTHMSGTAMDVSVLDAKTGALVDRGKPYLEMSELTPMASPFISEEARKNREEITAIFAAHGFVAYPYEFWHYSKGDAYDQLINRTDRPARYGAVDMDPVTGRTATIENPTAPLHNAADIRKQIEQALARVKGTTGTAG